MEKAPPVKMVSNTFHEHLKGGKQNLLDKTNYLD